MQVSKEGPVVAQAMELADLREEELTGTSSSNTL